MQICLFPKLEKYLKVIIYYQLTLYFHITKGRKQVYINIKMIIALVGNPNCGKTALFNALTGSRQKVANYPGVTVEKKIGRLVTPAGRPIQILDLPGTYSLDPASEAEQVRLDMQQTRADLRAELATGGGFLYEVVRMQGLFLIGAIMAESRHIHTIEKLIEPVRDMFIAIFFVTIGLLIDPRILFQYAWPITIISIAVITGKVISCSMGTFVTGHDGRTSLRVAMGKAQIGEFSFIIASLGLTLGVTSDFLYPIVVAVSILTTLFTPYLIKGSDPLTDWLDQRIPSAIKNVLVQYSGWISQIRSDNRLREDIRPFVRRITLHVFINTSVVIALFLSAAKVFDLINAYIDMREWTWLHDNYQQAFMWAISLLLSAPFMFAIYRKLEALGLLLADVRISTGNYSEIDRAAIHQLFAQLMPVFAIIALLMLVSALSSSILPPAGMLIVVGFLMASLIYLLRKQLVKIHAKLQIALTESFKDNSGNQPH